MGRVPWSWDSGSDPCSFWWIIHREHRGHNRDGHRGGGAGVRGSCVPQDQVRLVLGWPPLPEAPCSPSHHHDDAEPQEDAVPKLGRAMCSLGCQHGSVSHHSYTGELSFDSSFYNSPAQMPETLLSTVITSNYPLGKLLPWVSLSLGQ